MSKPVTAEWFRDTFGDDGDTMFKDYPGAGPRLTSELQSFFVKLRVEQFTQATAHKHEASCDDNSGELIYPVMVMRKHPVALTMNYDFMKAINSIGCGRSHMLMVVFVLSATFAHRIFGVAGRKLGVMTTNPGILRTRTPNASALVEILLPRSCCMVFNPNTRTKHGWSACRAR